MYLYYFNYTSTNNESYVLQQVDTAYHSYLREAYYTSVTWMDYQLGRLLQGVEKYNLRENTIIFFMGDHGFHLGEQGQWTKFTNFELGARIPLIIRHPNYTESHGKSCDILVEAVDIFPTLIDLSNVGWNNNSNIQYQLEGKSLINLFKTSNPNDLSNIDFPQYTYNQFARDNDNIMGCSLRTTQWRYTEWIKFVKGNATLNITDTLDWSVVYGVELYESFMNNFLI